MSIYILKPEREREKRERERERERVYLGSFSALVGLCDIFVDPSKRSVIR